MNSKKQFFSLLLPVLVLTQFRDNESLCGPACINCSRDRCLNCKDGYGLKETYCRSCEDKNCARCGKNYLVCNKCSHGYHLITNKDKKRSCEPCIEGCSVCKNNLECQKCEMEKYTLTEDKKCKEAFFTPITRLLFIILLLLWGLYGVLSISWKTITNFAKKGVIDCIFFPCTFWKGIKKLGRVLLKKRLKGTTETTNNSN